MMDALGQIGAMNALELGEGHALRISAMTALVMYLTQVNAPTEVFEALAILRRDMKDSPTKEEVKEYYLAAIATAKAGVQK